jgi:beta-lactamase class A
MNRREFNKTILALGGLTLATPLVALAQAGRPGPSEAEVPRPDLEQRIEEYIRQARKDGLIDYDEATSWSVYDFTGRAKLVSVNEDIPRDCASMMKPFVALAFFHKAEDGYLTYDRSRKSLMEQMIQHSSNRATNTLMDLVGGPAAVDRILHGNYPSIFRQTKILEKIPRGGQTYMNEASAQDYCRFLRAVWRDRLPYSSEIRRLMALPNRSRLCDGVPNIPPGTLVYHKTGTTARLCGDFGLLVPKDLWGKHYPYTLVAIIEKRARTSNLSRWITTRGDVIRKVSAIVYDEMRGRYGLV